LGAVVTAVVAVIIVGAEVVAFSVDGALVTP
jgi:hypothetical protein